MTTIKKGSNPTAALVAPATATMAAMAPNNERDQLDPIDWNLMSSTSDEAASLALLNVVEIDPDELSFYVEVESSSNDEKERPQGNNDQFNRAKRPRDDGNEKKAAVPQDEVNNNYGDTFNGEAVSINGSSSVPNKRSKSKSQPRRPMNAFGIFYSEERQRIVESMESSLSEDDIQRQVGRLWRNLPDYMLRKYEKLASEDKERYRQEMQVMSFKSDATSDLSDDADADEDDGQFTGSLPPPPPGMLYIPASGGPATPIPGRSTNESVIHHVTPPPAARGYPALPQSCVDSLKTSPIPRPDFRQQPRVVTDPGSAPAAPAPVWTAPVAPYPPQHQHQYQHQYIHPPVPPLVPYSVYSSSTPPVPAFRPVVHHPQQQRNHNPWPPVSVIPAGMQLAMPSMTGVGEQKYKVTYQCYKMKKEHVQSFLESLSAPRAPPPSQHYQGYQNTHAPQRW